MSLQSCLTLCDPMDCNTPRSSVHGILQARVLEWGTTHSSRDLYIYIYIQLQVDDSVLAKHHKLKSLKFYWF